jgi:hypothetical protein
MTSQIAFLVRVDLLARGHIVLQRSQSQERAPSGPRLVFELGLDHVRRPKNASVQQEDTNETYHVQGRLDGDYVSPAFVQRKLGYNPQLGEYHSRVAANMHKAEPNMSDTIYSAIVGILATKDSPPLAQHSNVLLQTDSCRQGLSLCRYYLAFFS